MAEKDARVFIGQLIAGETDGLIAFEKENSLYSLLVGIKPANLNLWASRPLDKDETDCVRAALSGISSTDMQLVLGVDRHKGGQQWNDIHHRRRRP